AAIGTRRPYRSTSVICTDFACESPVIEAKSAFCTILERRNRGRMQRFRRRRHDAPSLENRSAVPARDDAAGSFYDRHERHDIERLQARLDDEIDVAGGEHGVVVAVAAVTRELAALGDCSERSSVRATEHVRSRAR